MYGFIIFLVIIAVFWYYLYICCRGCTLRDDEENRNATDACTVDSGSSLSMGEDDSGGTIATSAKDEPSTKIKNISNMSQIHCGHQGDSELQLMGRVVTIESTHVEAMCTCDDIEKGKDDTQPIE